MAPKKKSGGKKAAARKPSAKRAAPKKAAKKAAKKAPLKRAAAKKAPAKKAAKKAAKAPAKKAAAKKAPAKKAAKKTAKRAPNPAFMKAMQPDADLAAVVGSQPQPRTEVTKRVWAYIKKNNLQDPQERRMINADDKLRKVFGGKGKVSMFEMTKHVNNHLK
jgi:chromatin remodeling complex protein RSC6